MESEKEDGREGRRRKEGGMSDERRRTRRGEAEEKDRE
jgi:hypothetical protein